MRFIWQGECQTIDMLPRQCETKHQHCVTSTEFIIQSSRAIDIISSNTNARHWTLSTIDHRYIFRKDRTHRVRTALAQQTWQYVWKLETINNNKENKIKKRIIKITNRRAYSNVVAVGIHIFLLRLFFFCCGKQKKKTRSFLYVMLFFSLSIHYFMCCVVYNFFFFFISFDSIRSSLVHSILFLSVLCAH